jgi:hypothetical protein
MRSHMCFLSIVSTFWRAKICVESPQTQPPEAALLKGGCTHMPVYR